MARLSDFVWNTRNPPRSVTRSRNSGLAKHSIPGRRGDIIQDMGFNSQDIGLGGKLYDQSGSTRESQRDSIMGLYVVNDPMVLCVDQDSQFGPDGDLFTDSDDPDDYWGWATLTVTAEASIKKVGDYSVKVDNIGGAVRSLSTDAFSSINTNLPHYSALCFWIRVPSITSDDDITTQIRTSGGNAFQFSLDVSDYLVANVWNELIFPIGEAAEGNWPTEAGSPDWGDITSVLFQWKSTATGPVYIDGFTITNAVRFSSMPDFTEPSGRPNQYDYRFDFKQYIQ